MATLKEDLDNLLELQDLDIKLNEIDALLEDLPQQIKAFEREGIAIQKELEELHKTSTNMKVSRREKEMELKAIEEQIKNLQSKLYDVKTNKEYQALQTEIETLKNKKSMLEDEILVYMEKDEQFKQHEKQLQEKMEKHRNLKTIKQKEIESKINQLEEERNQIKKTRDEYATCIDMVLLELYTRVKNNKKDGIAVCRITHDSNGSICNGCYVYIPGYLVEKIKRKTEIVQCENCGRILSE
ncbi:MAG: zinc ribbon domain-containing protein [Candidatus Ratteibacteria bacterium]